MANHKSAVKSHRLSIQRRDRNRQMRTRMRHALTKARSVIEAGDETKARQTIQNTVALIDKLAGKGVIHRNAASRHQARLVKRLSKVLATA